MICYAKLHQLCPTLCDPIECSPPGSSVHGVLWARILERVAMPSSKGCSQPRDQPLSLMSSMSAGRFLPIWEALTIIYHFFNNIPPQEKPPHMNSRSVEFERDKLCNACQTNTKHVCLYVCVYVCMYVCVCIDTHISTSFIFTLI